MIKLVVTDLDGTLFREDKTYNVELVEVINRLKAQNVLFCVCTGRQLYNTMSYFDPQLDIIYACNNGTHSRYQGQDIFKVLDKQTVKEVIDEIKKHDNFYVLAEGIKGVYIHDNTPAPLEKEIADYCNNLIKVSDIGLVDEDFCKITVCCLEGTERYVYPLLKRFNDTANVQVSGDIWIDVMPKDCHKGTAIKEIQKTFNILPEETLVFGDHLNDLEMLRDCPNSYAMKNAHAIAKQNAKNILDLTNDEDGVLRKIKELLLNA